MLVRRMTSCYLTTCCRLANLADDVQGAADDEEDDGIDDDDNADDDDGYQCDRRNFPPSPGLQHHDQKSHVTRKTKGG